MLPFLREFNSEGVAVYSRKESGKVRKQQEKIAFGASVFCLVISYHLRDIKSSFE
jgi:hypothetical protein